MDLKTFYDEFTGRYGADPASEFLTKPGETIIQASQRFGVLGPGAIKQNNKTFDHRTLDTPQPVNVTDNPEILSTEVKSIIQTLQTLGYRVAKNDSKNYNLNIVGIRNDKGQENRFDDQIWVFWKFNNRWELKKYKATTDPGLSWLVAPENPEGTAILKEGQYLASHRLGKHKGKYEALVQAKPVTVIRDFNRDKKLDYSSGKEQTGIFGINIHRANEKAESTQVNKWSAGCQVFANPIEFNEFIKLCKLSIAEWGNSFSYTLIRKNQLV
jgi:hypothetical protein